MRLKCTWSIKKAGCRLQKKTSSYTFLDCASQWPEENPHTHQDSTVVFPADMALNAKWNHIGPLCHNPTLSHDTGGGFQASAHMCT